MYVEIDGRLAWFGSDDEYLHGRGFMFNGQVHNDTDGTSTQVVVMELNEGNNNTRVACVATDDADGSRRPPITTPDAFITIIGKYVDLIFIHFYKSIV